jgi:hypothetical protein
MLSQWYERRCGGMKKRYVKPAVRNIDLLGAQLID